VWPGYSNANLFDGDDVLNVQANHLAGSRVRRQDLGAGYRIPIYRWSGIVGRSGRVLERQLGTVQGLFNVSGSGDVFGLRYTQLLGRFETYEHRASLGLDYRATRTTWSARRGHRIGHPDITVRPVSLAYIGRFLQGRPGSVVQRFLFAQYSEAPTATTRPSRGQPA